MKRWLAALPLILAACASDSVKNSEDPKVIYDAAVKFIDDERYLDAIDHLNEVRHRFPQSRYAALAELRTGDMEFKQENYVEAAAAYKVFVELYPTHADAPYAQYRRALSYLDDTPENPARDQSSARLAIEVAEALIARYATSKYVDNCKDVIVKSQRKLAEKEAYVARFYEKRGAFGAAAGRWKGLVKEFDALEKDKEIAKLLKEAKSNIDRLEALAAKQAGSDS